MSLDLKLGPVQLDANGEAHGNGWSIGHPTMFPSMVSLRVLLSAEASAMPWFVIGESTADVEAQVNALLMTVDAARERERAAILEWCRAVQWPSPEHVASWREAAAAQLPVPFWVADLIETEDERNARLERAKA